MSHYRDTQLQVTEKVCAKFKYQHISVFLDWKHSLLLTTDYTGAKTKNVYCIRHQCSGLRIGEVQEAYLVVYIHLTGIDTN